MNANKPVTRSSSLNRLNTLAVLNNINKNKRGRKEFEEMGDEVQSIGDLWVKIQGQFEDTNARIDSCKSGLEERITSVETQLTELKAENSVNTKQVAALLDETRSSVDAVSNQVERLERSQDLILSGVPFVQNENLRQMFQSVAAKLTYNDLDTPMVSLKRLSRQIPVVGSSPPILCQFAIRNERNEFYGRYLKIRNLTLRDAGLENNNRIYFNENLTPSARVVRSEAIKLKKLGLLQQVFSREGIVYVRAAAGAEAIGMSSTEQLVAKFKRNLS